MREKRSDEQKGNGMPEENGEEERKVISSLDFYPKNVDELMKETKMEYRQLINILSRMCVQGKAQKVSAGQFIKKETCR